MNCRFCGNELKHEFVDLGLQPHSNSFGPKNQSLTHYPLVAMACEKCFLVQTLDVGYSEKSIFGEKYPYRSGQNKAWVKHCDDLAKKLIDGCHIDEFSGILEIGSNDGCGLGYLRANDYDVLGIDPSGVRDNEYLVPTICDFYNVDAVSKYHLTKIDVILCRNTLAQIPDINGFFKAINLSLRDDGVLIIEVPSLMNLINQCQFDTIYHEHYFYFSLVSLSNILKAFGLRFRYVEDIDTHGGSYRVWIEKGEADPELEADFLAKEIAYGMKDIETYGGFQHEVDAIKNHFLSWLLLNKHQKIIGYGAAAKANTLLNFAGVKPDLLPLIVDFTPEKQEMFTPGSCIPVVSEDVIRTYKPSTIVIFPWNWKDAIIERLSYVREWGCKFVTFLPRYKEE